MEKGSSLACSGRIGTQEYGGGAKSEEEISMAVRFLMSACATQGRRGPGDYRVSLLDIKSAFFYGELTKHV